MQQKNSDLQ